LEVVAAALSAYALATAASEAAIDASCLATTAAAVETCSSKTFLAESGVLT
jgi:hypothetical protein